MIPRRFAQRKNGTYRLRASCNRGALKPAAHPPEVPVDRRLVDIGYTSTTDLGREPLGVHASVVQDRAGISTLLPQEVFGQEPFDRLVDGDVAVGLLVRQRELCTSVTNSASNRADSAAVPARTVRCTRRTDPSSKRPALTLSFHTPGRTSTFEPPLRPATPGPATTPTRRSPKREMLDPHASSVLWTRQHFSSWWQLAVHEFPGDALSRDSLAVDLHLAGAVSLLGARPQVVLGRAIHLGLEPIPESGHPRPSTRVRRRTRPTNNREVPERCRRPTPRSDPPAWTRDEGVPAGVLHLDAARKCTGTLARTRYKAHCHHFRGAPGRTRTCGLPLRDCGRSSTVWAGVHGAGWRRRDRPPRSAGSRASTGYCTCFCT